MDLTLNLHLADGYKSPAQRARRITEGWFKSNMYCPACPAQSLVKTVDNTKVVDFVCGACGSEFQLKAKAGPIGKKLRDAAYEPMMERIRADASPSFAFLSYDARLWTVRNIVLVPGHFLTAGVIERCKPLSSSARRAGWVGCNILAALIPEDGRIYAVSNGQVAPPRNVREHWKRFLWVADQPAERRGWTNDVLRYVRTFGQREFTLAEVYAFAKELSALHPGNRNVLPKIRQQLQVLRDRRIIRFLGDGRYRAV